MTIPELLDAREVAALLGLDDPRDVITIATGGSLPIYGRGARGLLLFRKADAIAYAADPAGAGRQAREARIVRLSRAHGGHERVYFLRDPTGFVKIGTSINVAQRVAELQAANPRELTLVVSIPGDQAVELELHAHFAEHRERGEWFRDAPEIEALARKIDRGDHG